MISAILAGVARHPRRVLGAAVALAGVLVGAHLLSAPDSDLRYAIPVLPPLLGLAALVLAVVAMTRRRPAAFTVDAGAFRAPSPPNHVLQAAGAAFMGATIIMIAVNSRTLQPDRPAEDPAGWFMGDALLVLACLVVVLSVVQIAAAWRGVGVQLGPDGVKDRGPLGTLTVPWDALTTASLPPTTPTALSLRLTYARPDLVRAAGLPLTRTRIRTDTIDALFLAHAVHHYLVHPERRQGIGTAAGYAELMTVLYGAPPDLSRS